MYLLRKLLFAAARFSFTFTAQHVPGVLNRVVDALSRFQMQEFRQLVPEAQMYMYPVPIPPFGGINPSILEVQCLLLPP